MPDIWMDVDTALAEVPVNVFPLTDDTDSKAREVAIAYDAGGMDLVWNFVTTAGAYTQTAVTPTTGGDYDWAHQGDAMYSIEMPASGGASINNDTEGFGWFSGVATGVLPWRGPVIGFRAAALNNSMVDGTTIDVNVTAMAAGVVTATAIANAAIDNAAFAADVGSTAYATNIIALAVRKALDEIKLDHLVAVADADDVVNDSIIGKLAATDGDWSSFVDTTDSLQSIRDHIGDGTNLTEAGGDGDHLTEAGGDGDHLTEAGGTGDHLTAIDLPNQSMNITGNLIGDVTGNVDGTVAGKTPAEAGDAMNLAADAIKAVSYDESTAFPLKADDSGATQIARVGADSDTLETLSDQIDSIPTTDNTAQLTKLRKYLMNKMEITNANGNSVIYDDDGTTPLISVSAAFSSDPTTTTRKDMYN